MRVADGCGNNEQQDISDWTSSCFTRYVSCMRKFPEVEEAKTLMKEAADWSMFNWLFQKSRVRETADRANAVLDKANRRVKSHWSAELKAAYQKLSGKGKSDGVLGAIDPETRELLEQVKHADEAARRARTDAQDTFDEAESQSSTALAREGCRKAIRQWQLDEKAIQVAEKLLSSADEKD